MSIPLAASQESLKERMALDPIFLATLTTYSDKLLGTVDTVYYWTRSGTAVLYDWEGGGDQVFEPRVLEADFGGEDPGVGSLIQRVPTGEPSDRLGYALTLENLGRHHADGTLAEDPYWAELRGKNLHGADLVVAELLVNPSLRLEGGTAQWDLRDLAGTEHTIRYRGELVKVDPVGDKIPLRFVQVEPDVPWPVLLNREKNHPEDFGTRLPVIVGHAERVPLSRIEAGTVSTFTAAVDKTATGDRGVTDASGFPASGDFSIWVNGEEMLCDGSDASANTVNVTARGQSGTSAVEHRAGAVVVELLDEVVLGAIGSDIVELQMLNPYTQEWTRVDTSYVVTPGDTQAIPGVDGLVTVRISQEKLRELFAAFSVAAQVTVQPDFEGSTSGTPGETATLKFNPSSVSDVTDNSAKGRMNSGATPPSWSLSFSTSERMEWTFITADLSGLGSKQVKRWRMFMDAECLSTTYDGTTATLTNDGIPNMGGDSIVANMPSGDRDTISSGWRNGEGSTLSDLTGHKLIMYSDVTGTSGFPVSASQEFHEVAVEAEYYVTPPVASGGDVALDRITDTEIVAASVGFNALFRAKVEGAVVPGQFVSGYAFDKGTGWSVDGLTHTDDTTEQTFDFPADTSFDDSDALTDWSVFNGGSIVLNTVDQNEGTGCVELTANTTDDAARVSNTYDTTDRFLALDLQVEDIAASRLDLIEIAVGSGISPNHWRGYRLLDLDPEFVKGQWRTIVIDLERVDQHWRGVGSLNINTIIYVQVAANLSSLGSGDNDTTILIDDVRGIPKSGVAQLNGTTGTLDLTSTGDEYTLEVDATNAASIESVVVSFTDEVETGTTAADAQRRLTVGGGQLVEGVATTVTPSLLDVGDPTYIDVETIRVEITRTAEGAAPTVSLATLSKSSATHTDFGETPGTLIENPADVDRWFVAEFCGMGHSMIGTTNATAKTSLAGDFAFGKLGPLNLAGNLAGLGFTLAEVRGRYLYESRSQGFISERATTSQYEIVTGNTLGIYPSASYTWDQDSYTSITEELADIVGLFTSSRVFFSYDASSVSGLDTDQSFLDVSIVDRDINDTSVGTAALVSAEEEIGRRLGGPVSLYMTRTLDSTEQFHFMHALYGIAHELALFRLDGVPHWILYDLEPGDVGSLTTPRGSVHSKCLVLSVQRPIGGIDGSMVVAEVL